MNFGKKFVFGMIAFGLMFGAAHTAQAADTWTMKISHAGPVTDDSDDHHGSLKIKEYIDKHSNGRIKVEIYPANQLGSYKEVVEQVQMGSLEVAHTSVDGIASFIPELTLIDLQYTMPDDATGRKFMRGTFIDEINAALAKTMSNVKLASMCNGGNWRSFYTTKKEVKSAADLKGLKIRTINSPLQQEFTRQMGANPTAVAWGEVYTALSTGVVDGLKIAINDILANKMDESIRYGLLDMHTYLYGFYWVNNQWLASMPEDLQKVVKDALVYGAEAQSDFNESFEMKAREQFVAKGGKLTTLTEEGKKDFLKTRDIMVKWYLDKYGDKGAAWLDKYNKAVAAAQAAK